MLVAMYCKDDEIKNYEVGAACSTHGGEHKFVQHFG
jgi:hypothetical protein